MNYTEIVKALNNASTFDLFRLSIAIQNLLKDPGRLQEIKDKLSIGQAVEYFDPESNTLVSGSIYKLGRTKVGVIVDGTRERWVMPLSWINLDQVDTTITNTKRSVDRNTLKVGDMVSYCSRENVDVYGKVIRLNRKTATVELSNQEQWRVHYEFLSLVVDGEADVQDINDSLLIEGKIEKDSE